MPFDPVDPKQSFPDLERGILRYWHEEDVFKRSIEQREGGESFGFYDGPPFATGLPHYGHLLAGTIKDVIPRYQTMRGKQVQRRFGWDCHGLPVEYEIEKEHGIAGKKDIEAMGVAAFNKLCRTAVQRYTNEWRTTVERMGRFVDMDWDYRTMDPEYMESIWWVFQELHKKELIYEGSKPMHICPRCATPLSNFEVTQNYKDVTDQSVVAKFKLSEGGGQKTETYILAWTTTPWTLPGNLFLAVNPEIEYVKVEHEGSAYILAAARVADIFGKQEPEKRARVQAKDLLGASYEPLFPYFKERYAGKAFRVVEGDFVTTEDGTGVVHIAPGFGEDDFRVGEREGVELLQHVTPDGRFTKDVTDFAGEHVKPKEDPMKTDRKIVEHLKKMSLVFDEKTYRHSYPHCWRCDTPLLNYATSSWFVEVEKIKDKMLKANKKTAWVPAHLRDGRFGKWLEGARDWAISRDRFWGTPLPIWINRKTKQTEVIGSRDELMAKAPYRFTKITVMRHGESQGNVDSIYQGADPGTDLTAAGKKGAQATAATIAADRFPVAAIYASPLARTRQTADAVASATERAPVIDDRLREVHFGDYEGKHVDFSDLAFVKARRAHKMEKGQVESIYHFDGMETWDAIEERCRRFLADILPRHRGEHIVIVTHADLVMNFSHIFSGIDKHKIVHQPYPDLAGKRTFYFDHETQSQMDLHKETVDDIAWPAADVDGSGVRATLVRHGQTDWNRDRIIQGQEADRPLTELGREQAQQTAQSLKGQEFDCIVTSDLQRAKETAGIIARELGLTIEEETDLLRERKFGVWVGKTLDEILKEHPISVTKGEFGLHQETPPDGESPDAFLRRARTAYEHIAMRYAGKKVLVVCHGGMIRALLAVRNAMTYAEAMALAPENGQAIELTFTPLMRRIPDVLDCWFESGSMPYAQNHWPFEAASYELSAARTGGNSKLAARSSQLPPGFPADFIAEGVDQTRGWFYTLMVLSTALYDQPAFKHCVVNGIVLAEDGKKMSKRLKNYPEPTEIVEKHGADAVRFALMHSPAVRGEDLKFSEKLVEEKLRNVLLPLWNSYAFFVTYASAAGWEPPQDYALASGEKSEELLDEWIALKTQDLVNKMTEELESYDLSASCDHLFDLIDGLTNWYIRLSRRRFAGKGSDNQQAFDTLYRVLLTVAQLLAPFCPFVSDAMYLNLTGRVHGSIHLTDWPKPKKLTKKEHEMLDQMEDTRTIVRLGQRLRSTAKIKVRQPLASLTFALPPKHETNVLTETIKEELNVKEVVQARDGKELADAVVQIDARKVGPRLGAKVQEMIRAAKEGKYEQKGDSIVVLGETLSADEAKIVYQGREGKDAECENGIVVTLDTNVTEDLKKEGLAREVIRAVQQLRKDTGLEFTDRIALSIDGIDDVLKDFGGLIAQETRSELKKNDGEPHAVVIDEQTVTIRFKKL